MTVKLTRVLLAAGLWAASCVLPAAAQVNSTESGALVFQVDGTEYARISGTAGFVGIGTTGPAYPIHGAWNTAVDSASLMLEQAGAGDVGVGLRLSNTRFWGLGIDNSDSDKFKISPAEDGFASSVLTIDTSGNVGIGTTSPLAKLDVTGNVSVSGVIDVGHTALACSSTISGSIRYSAVSSTMEYCNSTAWTSLGPSDTTPLSFYAYKTANQSIPSSAGTKLTFNATLFNTGDAFSTGTSRFTPTIPGRYLLTASVQYIDAISAGYYAIVDIYKNGSLFGRKTIYTAGTEYPLPNISVVVDANGTTDYFEVYTEHNYGSARNARGLQAVTNFSGSILGPQAGGSGGATPAGSTADVQYNSAGALAADTGAFTYASGVLKAPTISGTNAVNSLYVSATNGYVGALTGATANVGKVDATYISTTGIIDVGHTALACSSTISGSIRYETTSDTLQICTSAGWKSLVSGTVAAATVDGAGSANHIAYWSDADSLAYDSSQLYWDATKNWLGIGTATPGAALSVAGSISATGNVSASTFYSGDSNAYFYNNTTVPSLVMDTGNDYLSFTRATNIWDVLVGGSSYARVTSAGVSTSGVVIAGSTISGTLFYSGAGAAATPAHTFFHDTDTGLYSIGANTLGIATGGTERVRVDGSGNISATGVLDVGHTALACSSTISGSIRYETTSDTLQICTSAGWKSLTSTTTAGESDPQVLDVTAGNACIGNGTAVNCGNDNAASKDDITTRTPSGFWQSSTATTGEGWPVTTNGWFHLLTSTHNNTGNYYSMQFAGDFYDSNAIYYRATAGSGATGWNKMWHAGNDGAGSTLDADTLDGLSSASFQTALGYTPVNRAGDTMTGNLTAPAFLYSSDRRLKTDIQPIADGLAKLAVIEPVTFRFISDTKPTEHLGVIAQDVEKVYPQAVVTDETGFKRVDYPALVPALIAAVKELSERNADLQQRIEALERNPSPR